MNRKTAKRIWLAFITISLFAVIASGIYFNNMPDLPRADKRTAHISIDDVSHVFSDLSRNADSYESIFQNSFLSHLKEMHDTYGLKVTLYSYETADTFSISRFPRKYHDDFINSSDWLRIGFHYISPNFSKDIPAINVMESYRRFNNALSIIADPSVIAKSLRLHYFFGTDSLITFINNWGGVNTLLTADDPRISYDLTPPQDSILKTNGIFRKNGITYIPTTLRIENFATPHAIARHLSKKDTVVVFTHEWIIEQQSPKDIAYQAVKNRRIVPNRYQRYKFDRTVQWLHNNNFTFTL